jgi:gamma-aminobutyric acid type B receptor
MFNYQSYPHFFRIIPSENEYNEPRLALLRYYNWSRVGTLYQNEAKYALVSISIYRF